jgi:hypothetical protein
LNAAGEAVARSEWSQLALGLFVFMFSPKNNAGLFGGVSDHGVGFEVISIASATRFLRGWYFCNE